MSVEGRGFTERIMPSPEMPLNLPDQTGRRRHLVLLFQAINFCNPQIYGWEEPYQERFKYSVNRAENGMKKRVEGSSTLLAGYFKIYGIRVEIWFSGIFAATQTGDVCGKSRHCSQSHVGDHCAWDVGNEEDPGKNKKVPDFFRDHNGFNQRIRFWFNSNAFVKLLL